MVANLTDSPPLTAVSVAFSQTSDASVQLKVGMAIELMDYIICNQSVRISIIDVLIHSLSLSYNNTRVLCSTHLAYQWIHYEVCFKMWHICHD